MSGSVDPSSELVYWVTLDRIRGIGLGSKRILKLYQHFGSLQVAYNASAADWASVAGLPRDLPAAFHERKGQYSLHESLELLYKHNVRAITQIDPAYPDGCRALSDPPLVLYTRGHWDLEWFRLSVAVVGTREASDQAAEATRLLSEDLARHGFTIITGIAKGIDVAAHIGALKVEGQRSVAVVANGVDQIVPYSSKFVYEILARDGCIVSEYPPETLPEKGYFPARNRIIAALGSAVIVTEAGTKSGALITAERARDLNKPVFCLPGHAGYIENPKNAGCHLWLRKGWAKFAAKAADVLEELGVQEQPTQEKLPDDKIPASLTKLGEPATTTAVSAATTVDLSSLNEVERQCYMSIRDGADTVDRLMERTGLAVNTINSVILKLTLKKLLHKNGAYLQVR